MKKELAIKATHVKKTFKLPTEASNGIKQKLINLLQGKKGYKTLTPLKDISFEVEKGDFFGIVGRNGSGKSTLLKTIAGIYKPDGGSIKINGKLVPFIELGVGFNPELTGRENVYLNGALLGFSKDEVTEMYPEIVEFAELEEFMDQKLKNYSSGMQVRLAFSIAIKAQGDILVLDEVLAVGDEAFQRKCYGYFAQLKREKKTVILVSHSMSAVEQFCDKAILIEKGEVVKAGSSSEISELYSNLFLDQIAKDANKNVDKNNPDESKFGLKISKVETTQDNKITDKIKFKRNFTIDIYIDSKSKINNAIFGLDVVNLKNNNIVLATGAGSKKDRSKINILEGKNKISLCVKQNLFTEDSYYINVAVATRDNELLLKRQNIGRFLVYGVNGRKHGLFHPDVDIEVSHEPKK